MRPNTRSQHPSSNAPDPDPAPPARRTAGGRKRKASNPPAEEPASEIPAPAPARKAKKKRTNAPSAPTEPAPGPAPAAPIQHVIGQAPTLAAAIEHTADLAPDRPDGGERSQSIVIDPLLELQVRPPTGLVLLAQPVPPLAEPVPPLSESIPPLDDPFLSLDDPQVDEIEPVSSNDTGPGEATRNRGQRAPTLREQNAALAKANAELEAKVKQLSSDLRITKKYKVMWVKEYSKKAKSGTAPPDSLIPRPPGEKGKNGWNLQDAMGLKDDDPLYNEILRTARHCISRSGLDWEATYSEQDPGRLAACFKEVKRQHPYLERFLGDWPAKEMVISALQNRRKALSAKAKAKVSTDPQTQASFMAAAAEVDANDE
ncbi:hypothetical protein FS837_009936 [Tulasnella sp. UAMH 9824]|nr:hypothetical protein FS837_009936 [Tulasnella sp. UAMH 9824]